MTEMYYTTHERTEIHLRFSKILHAQYLSKHFLQTKTTKWKYIQRQTSSTLPRYWHI